MKGRQLLYECSKNVIQLRTIRRVSDAKQDEKDMLQRVRLGVDVMDADVKKLQSLHVDNIAEVHGPDVVKQIEKDAVYLFWTNEKRIKHNFSRLVDMNSVDNPTAIIKSVGTGTKYAKSIQSHFQTNTPSASLICLGAKVCLQGQNICPLWGLHNGACGTVQEIIFEQGKNPNNGDHPKFVVVNFPQYRGPAWDIDRPKVTYHMFVFIQISGIKTTHITVSNNSI
jgi:hypothetical protein